MFYDILYQEEYVMVILSRLTCLLFHQNVIEVEGLKINLNQNKGMLLVGLTVGLKE